MGYHSHPQRYLPDETIKRVEVVAAYHSKCIDNKIKKSYVIGDIHGMDESLLSLLELITEKAKIERVYGGFIFLGDYVDRGPGVAQVLAIVRLLQETMPKGSVITLLGNHENMFIEEMRYPAHGDMYISKTGRSFGRYGFSCIPPKDLMEWMHKLPHYYEDELHYYVHAGIIPEIPIEQQTKSTLIWIREEFLNSKVEHPKYILHGHTTRELIDLHPNRCGIDTGACFDKDCYLTCAEVDENIKFPSAFFQVRYDKKNWLKFIKDNYYFL